MSYQLGNGVKVGEKILLKTGWEKILAVKNTKIKIKNKFLKYNSKINK